MFVYHINDPIIQKGNLLLQSFLVNLTNKLNHKTKVILPKQGLSIFIDDIKTNAIANSKHLKIQICLIKFSHKQYNYRFRQIFCPWCRILFGRHDAFLLIPLSNYGCYDWVKVKGGYWEKAVIGYVLEGAFVAIDFKIKWSVISQWIQKQHILNPLQKLQVSRLY